MNIRHVSDGCASVAELMQTSPNNRTENIMAETTQANTTGQPPAQPEDYIKKPQVAKRLNQSVRSVDNWMKQGLVPYYKIGRSVVFKWSDVEAHLKANCRVSLRGS
jgi:excisionase family DNA binding protein